MRSPDGPRFMEKLEEYFNIHSTVDPPFTSFRIVLSIYAFIVKSSIIVITIILSLRTHTPARCIESSPVHCHRITYIASTMAQWQFIFLEAFLLFFHHFIIFGIAFDWVHCNRMRLCTHIDSESKSDMKRFNFYFLRFAQNALNCNVQLSFSLSLRIFFVVFRWR